MSDLNPVPGDPPFDDLDTLAGEFVLGVLTADEMREVRVRSRANPALAEAISRWELRLLPLAEAVAPREPPAALWRRIEQAVAALPLDAEVAGPSRRLPMPAPRRVWPWQLATGIAVALAAGFAALAFIPGSTVPSLQRIATIGPLGAPPPAFLADARSDGSVVLTTLSPADVPQGRDLELWVLPPGAQRVASLGVLPIAGRKLSLPAVPATGTQLLISLEPAGGSTTGQPTGAVLYAGTLAAH